MRWKGTHLWLLAAALHSGCASGPQRAAGRELRLDTETSARVRHAAAITEGTGALAPTATQAVASQLVHLAPALLALLKNDNAAGELEERLVECARQAERQVNSSFFGNRSPTREECGEEVDVDGCGGSAYAGSNQGQLYKEALGGEAVLISPQRGVTR